MSGLPDHGTDPVHGVLSGSWMPQTDTERECVRKQLERILGSTEFKTGTRGPVLLRHIVESALTGHSDGLKERSLGVEVFGREPTYDTNLDPVVRVGASRIRQKLALYYQDPQHRDEMRILLPPGAYVPVFQAADHAGESVESPRAAANGLAVDHAKEAAGDPLSAGPSSLVSRGRFAAWGLRHSIVFPVRRLLYLVGMVAFAIGVMLFALPGRRTDLDRLWAPLLNSSEPVTVCVGTGMPPSERALAKFNSALTIVDQRKQNIVAWPDAVTMARMARLLSQMGHAFRVQKDDGTSLQALRSGPAVLIGAYNNLWVIRLAQQARFRFRSDPTTHINWIEDSKDPSRQDWKMVTTAPFAEFKEDYGIVMRVFDATTERTLLAVAGLGGYGTLAAGELATTPEYLETLVKRAPSGWHKMNMQIVIRTRVIEDSSGPPEIMAISFW
jgi:hypothetical protein